MQFMKTQANFCIFENAEKYSLGLTQYLDY